jgi:hypothetical protein
MKWITRARPKTDRIACPWLITKFIDPAAEILYVPAGQVLDIAGREDAVSFDAPGARYDHRDGHPPAPSRPASPAPPANKAQGTARHPGSRSASPSLDVRPPETAARRG